MAMNTGAIEPKRECRIALRHHRVELGSSVWYIDAKYDPNTGHLKVSGITGNISDQNLLKKALKAETNALDLKYGKR